MIFDFSKSLADPSEICKVFFYEDFMFSYNILQKYNYYNIITFLGINFYKVLQKMLFFCK